MNFLKIFLKNMPEDVRKMANKISEILNLNEKMK